MPSIEGAPSSPEGKEVAAFTFDTDEESPNKTSIAWDYGIWLGRCTQSDEHFVGTAEEVYRTTSIRRLPKSDRYNRTLLESMVCTPWSTRGVGRFPTNDFVLPPPVKRQLQEEVQAGQAQDPGTTPQGANPPDTGGSSSSTALPAQPSSSTTGQVRPLEEADETGQTTKSRRMGEQEEQPQDDW